MKRYGNLFDKIINKKNIFDAHNKAKKGKKKYQTVIKFEEKLTDNINKIHDILKNKEYKVSEYIIDTRVERGKERIIFKLPYSPDRVIHHCLLQIIEPILAKTYIKDTYQSIKGRGIHKAKDRVKMFLTDKPNTQYCLKIDIKKFYPSVNNEILKNLIRKKIKCKDTLWLMDEIIDSTKGLPIGNYTSQTFGNFYLSYFDHFVKEKLKVKYYVRYADDMVFFSNSKEKLHLIKIQIENYLNKELDLQLKSNWQIFPTYTRGVDFLGFRFFNRFILIRKSIKKAYCKTIKQKQSIQNMQKFASYYGWLIASNSYNLIRKTISKELIQKYQKICDKIKISNPFRKIILKPKKVNQYGYYQPTLFNFI